MAKGRRGCCAGELIYSSLLQMPGIASPQNLAVTQPVGTSHGLITVGTVIAPLQAQRSAFSAALWRKLAVLTLAYCTRWVLRLLLLPRDVTKPCQVLPASARTLPTGTSSGTHYSWPSKAGPVRTCHDHDNLLLSQPVSREDIWYNWEYSTDRDPHCLPSAVLQDELVVALPDRRPAAAVHLLVLPRAHIPNVSSLTASDAELGEHDSAVLARQDVGVLASCLCVPGHAQLCGSQDPILRGGGLQGPEWPSRCRVSH